MTKRRVPADDIVKAAEKLGLLDVLKRLVRQGEKLDDIDIGKLRRAAREGGPPTRFDRDALRDGMPVHGAGGDRTTYGRAVDADGAQYQTRSDFMRDDRAEIDAVNERLQERAGVTYRSGNAHHAEQKFAAGMANDPHITEADLVINNPAGPCPGRLGCDDTLPVLLRPDQTLRVHWRDANGDWQMTPYQGVP
jgi:hypothetical protein